ncbi:helix-turn-helix transcriptional regulator [Micromonospora sp. CPCC 205556]|uniref:helix-turn-helix transcriptional regulator n=1 Tax=Micromonospora sp. CPCC 205556 TaxID=3122398 RepID=UPI002FEF909B
MTSRFAVPLDHPQVPEELWSREDMRAALGVRDIGTVFPLLARHTGASQTRIGAAVGLEQGYVSRIIAGRKVSSIEVLERIADGCRMPDEARMTLGLAPRRRRCAADMAAHPRGGQSDAQANRSWREDVQAGRAASYRQLSRDVAGRVSCTPGFFLGFVGDGCSLLGGVLGE